MGILDVLQNLGLLGGIGGLFNPGAVPVGDERDLAPWARLPPSLYMQPDTFAGRFSPATQSPLSPFSQAQATSAPAQAAPMPAAPDWMRQYPPASPWTGPGAIPLPQASAPQPQPPAPTPQPPPQASGPGPVG